MFTYLTPNSLSHVGIYLPLPPKNLPYATEEMAFLWGKMYHLVPHPRYNSPIAGPSWQPSKTSTIGTCFDQKNLRNDAWRASEILTSGQLWGHMICGHYKKIQQQRFLFKLSGPQENMIPSNFQGFQWIPALFSKFRPLNHEPRGSPRWPTKILLDLDRPCQVWYHECEGFYLVVSPYLGDPTACCGIKYHNTSPKGGT